MTAPRIPPLAEMDPDAQVRGVAWRLHAPSPTGGKVYSIAVFGELLITAWGRADHAGRFGAGAQIKTTGCPDHGTALDIALRRTTEKEKKGYTISIGPSQTTLTARYHASPETIITRILRDGEPL